MSQELRTTIQFWVEVISLIALVIYVIKTWQMASETKRAAEATQASVREMQITRERETAPYIVVYLDIVDNFAFSLVIKNLGKTSASNLKINITPPLTSSFSNNNYDVNDLSFLKKGFPSFPPNYEFRATFDTADNQLSEINSDLVYIAEVSYEDAATNLPYQISYTLDPAVFKGILNFEQMGDLKREIKSISSSLSSIDKTIRKH